VPGARAGRRDYSHLPRVEVTWDFLLSNGFIALLLTERYVAGRAGERTCGTVHPRGRLGVPAVRGDEHCSWPSRPVSTITGQPCGTWRTAQGTAG
jgi:hypothetical protein